ncbi:MAG: FecR family protein [Porticoccaceae bacterium]
MNTTGKNSLQKPIDERAIDQALGWVVRLRSDRVTDADIEAFADWLSASDQHELAWSQALDAWETAGVLSFMPDLMPSTDRAADSVQVSLTQLLRRGFAGFWRSLSTMATSLTALAVSLTAVAVAVILLQGGGQTYSTATGEYQQVWLDDGSLIELNTDSSVVLSLSDRQRNIELVRGEAFFTVAPDKTRPFVVIVGGAEVRALGTAFNIYRQGPELARVHVVEGVVRVSETQGSAVSAPESRMLLANQALEFSETTGIGDLPEQNMQQATAWREGQILFDGASLKEAATVLNRYLEQKIILHDSAHSAHRISGIFSSRERETTLLAVAQAFDLELSRQGDKWLLSKPNP